MLFSTRSISPLLFTASLAFQTVFAVSLIDFKPRVSNMPSACEKIYIETIPGCEASDFTSSECSTTCITALDAVAESVMEECSGQGITGGNIIVAFMSGSGVHDLCPNAPVGSTRSSASTTTIATSTTATPSIASIPTTASPLTNSATGIVADTSTMSSFTTSTSHVASSATADSQSSSSQSTTTVLISSTVLPSSSLSSTTDSTVLISTGMITASGSPTASGTSSTADTAIPAQETSGGGGSPFDAYTTSNSAGSTRPSIISSILAFAVPLALLAMMAI